MVVSRRLRRISGVALVAVTGVSIPALAALMSHRAAAPAQISLNVAVPAFQIAGLVPGDQMTRCVRVRNEGDDPIQLVDGVAVTGDLAPYLLVTAERGSGLGDVGPSCLGFTPAGTYAFGTKAGGVATSGLVAEYDASWTAHASKSLRVTIAMPAGTPIAAASKQGTVILGFAGTAIDSGSPGAGGGTSTTPNLPGGIAPGTSGGFDKNGNFLTNSQIKRRLRIGRARLLKNGDVVVDMVLPAGGAIRAKVILGGNRYYAHTLLPIEWGPKVRVVLHRRALGRDEVRRYKSTGRMLVARVTTRYRWAHGPDAFVQPEQKLVLYSGR
jgi:hypothetical protein